MDLGKALWGKVSDLESVKESGGMGYATSNTLTLNHDETKKRIFDDPIGLEVEDYVPGRYFLSVNPTDPDPNNEWTEDRSASPPFSYCDAFYTDIVGLLSKRVLIIEITDDFEFALYNLGLYNQYFKDMEFNSLMYVFDTTTDKMGMGLVAEKGWYAANSQTLAFTPVDLSKHRCMAVFEESEAYMSEFGWEKCETINYVVSEENIAKSKNIDAYAFSYVNFKELMQWDVDGFWHVETAFVHGVIVDGENCRESGNGGTEGTSITINTPTIHKIDPKFLPEGGVGYSDPVKTVLAKTTIVVDEGGVALLDKPIDIKEGEIYDVTLYGGGRSFPGRSIPAFNAIESDGTLSGALFEVTCANGSSVWTITVISFLPEVAQIRGGPTVIMGLPSGADGVIEITQPATIHTIDPKFIPDTVATKADIFGAMEASY